MLNDKREKSEHMEAFDGRLYGSIEAAKKAGISLRQLYHWVDSLHVVSPRVRRYGLRQFRRFSCKDLEVLSEVKVFVERGYTLQAAVRIVKGQQEP